MEEDILVQLTKMIKLVKVDHAGQTELKWFTPMDFWMKFLEFWAERKVLIKSTHLSFYVYNKNDQW